MNFTHYFPVALFAASILTGCSKKHTKEVTAGLSMANLDTTITVGNDFYNYACGGWRTAHPLTPEYSRYGTFEVLAETNRQRVRQLIEDLAKLPQAEGTVEQKIADVYRIAMDSTRLNKDGLSPIDTDWQTVDTLSCNNELLTTIVKFEREGLSPYFACYVDADMMDSKNNLFQIVQGGLSLGQKSYYLDDDEDTKRIRNAFRQHIVKMFTLAGCSDEDAQQKMEDVMLIETRLAKASRSNVELRDQKANYHKFSRQELEQNFNGIDWNKYFLLLGIDSTVCEVNVGQPEALQEAIAIINDTELSKQKSYLQWHILDAAAPFLSDTIVNTNFDFYGRTMKGTEEMQPRWKRAVGAVNSMLGEAMGQIYVKQYFPPEAKKRMLQLVQNLQKALGERIEAQTWMSDATKAKAIEKLNAFYIKIGYPNKWKDYSPLSIDSSHSYWENAKRANTFAFQEMLNKAGHPVDRDEWYMTPQTINAYYNPTTNEICFPAGILQYPFFDMNADDAFNYGAIGVVIGHEMTHGFDDQGRHFDKEGNFIDWWTKEDAEQFNKRTQVMVDFFDHIEVLPGLYANGKLTLGENIADHGGLNVSYQAFKNATKEHPLKEKDGFTPEQRFFLAYGNVWACNIRPEEIRVRTKSDPHSLGEWRVNGALPHINAWYEAWNITPKDSLYVKPEKRVDIW